MRNLYQEKQRQGLGYLFFTVITAAVLFYIMFVIKPMNFWIEMSLTIMFLVFLAFLSKRDLFSLGKLGSREILLGILSALVLYIVFYIGNIISGLILPFKDVEISMVYGNKAQGSLVMIGLLLLLIIGPCEEIFWRGFIQNTLMIRLGENKGYIAASFLYAGVHIATGNFMLIMAALVCGIFWGFIYKKGRNLVPVVISHALWDLTIFVLLPI